MMIRIKSLFFKLLYGISLLLSPFTNDSKALNSLFGLFVWMNTNFMLYVILDIFNIGKDIYLTLSLISMAIIFLAILIFYFQIIEYIDKIKAEKLYRMVFTLKQKEIKGFSSSAIELHERYGKDIAIINKITYLEDKVMIEKYKKYNRKLMVIGAIYSVFSIIGAYVFFKTI